MQMPNISYFGVIICDLDRRGLARSPGSLGRLSVGRRSSTPSLPRAPGESRVVAVCARVVCCVSLCTLESARARVARGRRAGGSTHLDVYVRCTVVVYGPYTHARSMAEP